MRHLSARFTAWLAVPAVIIAAALALAVPAHAAGRTSHQSTGRLTAAATPFQNRVLDAALSRIPGGTRVSPGEAVWGGVTLRVSPSAAIPAENSACPANEFCAWNETGFSGTCSVSMNPGTGDFFDWGAFSQTCNPAGHGTFSWANNSPDRVWKEQSYSGGTALGNFFYTGGGTTSGNSWCISPGDSNNDVTDNQTRTDGWIQMTFNTSKC